jgi:GTP cyclohydrolase I
MFEYTIDMFNEDIIEIGQRISRLDAINIKYIYAIPQGGVPAGIALAEYLQADLIPFEEIGEHAKHKVLIVDDLIDSGKTICDFVGYPVAVLGHKFKAKLPICPAFFAARSFPTQWIHFWWEPKEDIDPERLVTRLLQYIGEDASREGLAETPARVIKSYKKLYGGYGIDPKSVMKTFTEGACDELVLLNEIHFHSTCEHHMLPFSGTMSIGYIPNGKVIGVSKLARLAEIFCRRLQIQERIGEQITSALMDELHPLGAACVIKAQHHCMTSRGVQQQSTVMVTSSLKGVFRDSPEARSEFMGLISK